jgi:Fur family transcriptional regulator, ferric uptake regulator
MVDESILRNATPPPAPLEQFAQFLRGREKRMTEQRRLIVEEVYSHHDHFDAEELMDHLKELVEQRKVSRPTVYRTLSELVEAGLLRKMTLNGRGIYEHDLGYPTHDHLLCETCNSLIEFHSEELAKICETAAKKHSFEMHGHRMFVMGVCKECRARQKKK